MENCIITDCQKDYIDNTITVHFEGTYDKIKCENHVRRCYGSSTILSQIAFCEPYEYQGFKNDGCVVYKVK